MIKIGNFPGSSMLQDCSSIYSIINDQKRSSTSSRSYKYFYDYQRPTMIVSFFKIVQVLLWLSTTNNDRQVLQDRSNCSSKFTIATLNKTSVISVRSFPFLSVPFLYEWLQFYIPSFMTSIIDQSENPFWQMTHHSLWTYSLNEFQRDLLYLSIECQFRAQRTRQLIWWLIIMTSCLSSTNQKSSF